MARKTTARDHPPEEALEDTSFARGLRILLTIADRGEVRAEDLSALLETPASTIYRATTAPCPRYSSSIAMMSPLLDS